jgi:hypothetical protein
MKAESFLVSIMMILFGATALLVAYGVVLIVFRHAFGVDLPNPFSWLGLSHFH